MTKRLTRKFSDIDVKVRLAGANGLTVLGGIPDDKDVIHGGFTGDVGKY